MGSARLWPQAGADYSWNWHTCEANLSYVWGEEEPSGRDLPARGSVDAGNPSCRTLFGPPSSAAEVLAHFVGHCPDLSDNGAQTLLGDP